MFKDSKSFSSFSVNDLKKAKEFYGGTLGLRVTETPEGLQLKLTGGNTVFLYPKPNHTPASFTVLNFPVDDIEEAVDELIGLGLRLEQYDLPDLEDRQEAVLLEVRDQQIAWFKDPAWQYFVSARRKVNGLRRGTRSTVAGFALNCGARIRGAVLTAFSADASYIRRCGSLRMPVETSDRHGVPLAYSYLYRIPTNPCTDWISFSES